MKSDKMVTKILKDVKENYSHKTLSEIVADDTWEIAIGPLDKNVLYVVESESDIMILNEDRKKTIKKHKNYLIARGAYEMLNNKNNECYDNILQATKLEDLYYADWFAYTYLLTRGEEKWIPNNIREILKGYDKFII